jgi:hypothetical protein
VVALPVGLGVVGVLGVRVVVKFAYTNLYTVTCVVLNACFATRLCSTTQVFTPHLLCAYNTLSA